MKQNEEVLAPVSHGEVVEIRRVINGKTVLMIARLTNGAFGAGMTEIRGHLLGYDYAGSHVDERINRAVRNVNRLQYHLAKHCPSSVWGECEYGTDAYQAANPLEEDPK